MRLFSLLPLCATAFRPPGRAVNPANTLRCGMSSVPGSESAEPTETGVITNDVETGGDDADDDSNVKPQNQRKLHTLTVCMVPPPSNLQVWRKVSEMREFLKDPGFYRWPPHVNLLYPFVDYESSAYEDGSESSSSYSLREIVEKLRQATAQCAPFEVSLNSCGTFGGKSRGVLWLHPSSSSSNNSSSDSLLPLIELQSKLHFEFEMCNDLSQKGGKFTPHLTLSHFKNLGDALRAQSTLEEKFSLTELKFVMDRIYLLSRKGDEGQFQRVAEIYLGNVGGDSDGFKIHPSPVPFPDMPLMEADWVYEERMALKKRRNWGGRRGGGQRQRRTASRTPRVPDTPEEIARKRAERRAKREQLELEQASQETDG